MKAIIERSVAIEQRLIGCTAPYTACLHTGSVPDAATLQSLADGLARSIARSPRCSTVVLMDPAAVSHPPTDDQQDAVAGALDHLGSILPCTVIWYPWGGPVAERLHVLVYETAIDVMGYDLIEAKPACMYAITEYRTTDTVAFGIADASTGVVITASHLAKRIESLCRDIPAQSFTDIYVMPNVPVSGLSWDTITPLFRSLVDVSGELGMDQSS